MKAHRRRRLQLVVGLMLAMAIGVGFALYALKQNISLYFTPGQIVSLHVPAGKLIRLGGYVKKGSVLHHGLKVQFILTDYHGHNVLVRYRGLLPSLFRVGQGIVTQGKLNVQGVFVADQVLAKHNAVYHPPELKKHGA